MRIVLPELDWNLTDHSLPEALTHYCVHVHRKAAGDKLTISDGAGREAVFSLVARQNGWHVEQVGPVLSSQNVVPITLFCGLPKGDKLDRITRQVSELGIAELVLLKMERNIVQLDEQKAAKKLSRLHRIAMEAARQSERSRVLEINGVFTFTEGLRRAESLSQSFFFHPNQLTNLPSLPADQSVGLFVGPEGGFSSSECLQMKDSGFVGVHLGQTILRTETASVVCIASALSKMSLI